jgi:hypothetical protein
MPGIGLEEFKNSIVDLCRPNRFFVSIEDDSEWEEDFGYLVKACSMPSRTIGEIPLNWNGMVYKVPADPTFDDFTITFLNDIDCSVKDYFENWLELIATMNDNTRMTHDEVKATVVVQQLNGNGEVVRTYRMLHAHPKQMDAIELDYDTTDSVENFVITFSYSYFEVEGVTDSAGEGPSSTAPKTSVPTTGGYA